MHVLINRSIVFLFISSALFFSCADNKKQQIQFQIYNDDRLMFSAFHKIKEGLSETELWNELKNTIQFTAIDGSPVLPPSNNLFHPKPYIDPSGNITIIIHQNGEIIAKTNMNRIQLKSVQGNKAWVLDHGEASRIISIANQTLELDNVIYENLIEVPDSISEPAPTNEVIAQPTKFITVE